MPAMQLVAMRWPRELLAAIDAAAADLGITRAAWIRTACQRRLEAETCPHTESTVIAGERYCNECGELVA